MALGAKESQIIISTHSSFVSNKLGLDHLILLDNKKTARLFDLPPDIQDFFRKLPGYQTLRLLLCKKAILVEGDSDELIVQKAYVNTHDGRIKEFLLEKCKSLIRDGIDEESFKFSHRNNEMVCKYSSQLYPDFPESEPCECCEREDTGHDGVFFVRPDDVERYLDTFEPMQLRWSNAVDTNSDYPVMNFGESKGLTFDRVLIFPTSTMLPWIVDHAEELAGETRAKFYVGLTRAKYSPAIIYEYDPETEYAYAKKFPSK